MNPPKSDRDITLINNSNIMRIYFSTNEYIIPLKIVNEKAY